MPSISWPEHFTYDETSPSCLKWARNVRSGRNGSLIKIHKGSSAGSENGKRYWHVMLNLRDYRVHRIIWELHFGEIHGDVVVDHIDGDSKNNVISNLRLVNQKVNCRNRKKQTSNTSGKNGVSFISNGKGKYYCLASWRDINCKPHQKCFSIERLGIMVAFKLALQYREQKILEMNNAGAGYSKNHGE